MDLITTNSEPAPDTPRRWQVTHEDGIRVHWRPIEYANAMPNWPRIRAFFRFAAHAARRAVGLKADVVFASSTPLTVALPGVFAAWRQRVPMVFEVRDSWPELPIVLGALRSPPMIAAALALERFAYRNATRIVALSPGMKERVVSRGTPPEHVTVIPNGCDLDMFPAPQSAGEEFRKSLPWLGHRPLVLYGGALGLVNGLDYYVHLANAVWKLDPEIRFLLLGQGKERDRLRGIAAELGILEKNLFFIDPLIKNQMPAAFAASTIACSLVVNVPNLINNSANKFFDTLAAGRPIAINHAGWLAKIIEDHDCGLVFPPVDTEVAARQLVRAIRDEAWLRRAGQNARAVAEKLFDRDRLAGQLCDVLTEAVAVGPIRPLPKLW